MADLPLGHKSVKAIYVFQYAWTRSRKWYTTGTQSTLRCIIAIAMKIPRLGKHTMYSEKLFLWLQMGSRFTAGSCGQIQSEAPKWSRFTAGSRDQIQAEQPLENMIFVSFPQSCRIIFVSLKCAIIAIKTCH